jgi:membrane protein required for colicin V production
MNAIDLIVLIPIAFGAYRGFTKGLLMELVTLLALILATIISFKFLHQGIELITPYIGKNESIIPLVAFLLIFVIVVVGITLLGKTFKTILEMTILGSFDKIAGAIVGALKWAYGFSIILWLMESAGVGMPDDLVASSVVYPYFVAYGPKLIEIVSYLIPYFKELIASIKELIHINPNS